MGPCLSFFTERNFSTTSKKLKKNRNFPNLRGAGGQVAEKIPQDGQIFHKKNLKNEQMLQQRKLGIAEIGLNHNWAFW